jgi:hypothetical protein
MVDHRPRRRDPRHSLRRDLDRRPALGDVDDVSDREAVAGEHDHAGGGVGSASGATCKDQEQRHQTRCRGSHDHRFFSGDPAGGQAPVRELRTRQLEEHADTAYGTISRKVGFHMGHRPAAMKAPVPLLREALMTLDEIGVYHGYRVVLEQDQQGWRAEATLADKPGLSVCWSNRRDIVLDLIRASIDRSVDDATWPELPSFLRRLP